jgi:membrane protein
MAKEAAARRSGLETVLAPAIAALAMVVALVHSLLDRRPRSGSRPHGVGKGAAPEASSEARPRSGLKRQLARIPGMRFPLAVQERYGDLHGNNLAAAVAFQAFVSLFPLLLVLVAAVGFVAHYSDVDIAGRIIANLGLTGESADTIVNAVGSAEENRSATAPLGLVALLWSGLGLVNAFQFAFNQVWQVEERGLKDKAVGLLWLSGAVVLFVGASAATTVLNWLPGFVAPVGVAVGLAVNFGLWLWTFRVLPNRELPWRALVPGAAVGAIGMEVLKIVGGIYVPRAVSNSSELYGSLGVVFAVLAWLLIFGRLVLYATVVNVIRWEQGVGTVRTTIEVPAGPGIESSDEVTRAGRVPREAVDP